MPKIKSFTDLEVWQESHKLAKMVYDYTENFPDSERYGLRSQMRRAAVSVPSNIAEGFGMRTYKNKSSYYYDSQGSLNKLKSQSILSRDVGYLSKDRFSKIASQANSVHRLLTSFISSTNKYKKDL